MKKRVGAVVGILVFVWLVAAAVIGAMGGLEAKKGRDGLAALQGGVNISILQDSSKDGQITSAAAHLRKANSRLDNPVLIPLRYVPWVGSQLNASRTLTEAAAQTADISLDTLQKVRTLTAQENLDRASLLTQAADICTTADAKLRTVKLGSAKHLVAPLADARETAVDQLNTLDSALIRGGAASGGLAQLLTGDNRYLLVAANNAEMRNGSGMFLQAGLLTTSNGKFDVSGLVSTGTIVSTKTTWTGDIQDNWKWLGREGDPRNLMLSPRYDVNAPIAKQIWESAGKPRVNGVITIDVDMMKALLAVTGPVSAGGFSVDSASADKALMFDQYAGIDYDSQANRENADRREVLAQVAALSFSKFSAGDWSITTAAREFSGAAQGRHLLIWSADEALNKQWQTAGVGGTLDSGSTMVSVANLGTNKLDQFIKLDTKLEAGQTTNATNVTMTVTVTNNAPNSGPQYVLGPIAESPAQEGEYIGMLSFSLPGDSDKVKFDGNLPLSVSGRDGDNVQVATGIDIQRGGKQVFVLKFVRPSDAVGTTVRPSAHIPAVSWTFRDEKWDDTRSKTLAF